MITIIDYGMGNLGSVLNMFKRVGANAHISSDLEEIRKARKILLPGVGSYDSAVERINRSGMREALDHKALVERVPTLGICLGMQLLTEASEEGKLPGLGWIKGKAHHFKGRIDRHFKVPHMGWNVTHLTRASALTDKLEGELRFYFVHSYFVRVEDERNSMMKTSYGLEFDSGIIRDNIFGAQFHPEKSHRFGMKLFENFSKI